MPNMLVTLLTIDVAFADSNLFIIETTIVGMSIINIIVYTAVICIDCCLERQERKLRYEYLNMHRAIITQEENIQCH